MTDHRISTTLGAALLWLAVPAALLPALADPYDYRDRRDTITSSAGNANASNIAIQTIDRWPPYAKNARIHLNGPRAGLAITRYQQNRSIDPKGLDNSPLSDQSGPGGQSGASLAK
jgi:hypothetical protein